jgi:Na+/H+ antiporter NhaD/arsenite permease-like protein
VAIIGAAVMVAGGGLPWDRAVAAVDAHTLVLLFGMMIVAAYLRLSGFFHLVTYWAVRRARTPAGLLLVVIVASGVLSALFVNDVVCLVLAPVVLAVTRQLHLPPVPYLIALATAANVGGLATLTGNPQNMLVGSFSGISYRAFLARQGPVALVGLLVTFGVLWLAYRHRLAGRLPPPAQGHEFPVHQRLMLKTMAAVGAMLVAFLAGVPIALVAVAGAAVCLLTRSVKPDKVYREARFSWASREMRRSSPRGSAIPAWSAASCGNPPRRRARPPLASLTRRCGPARACSFGAAAALPTAAARICS